MCRYLSTRGGWKDGTLSLCPRRTPETGTEQFCPAFLAYMALPDLPSLRHPVRTSFFPLTHRQARGNVFSRKRNMGDVRQGWHALMLLLIVVLNLATPAEPSGCFHFLYFLWLMRYCESSCVFITPSCCRPVPLILVLSCFVHLASFEILFRSIVEILYVSLTPLLSFLLTLFVFISFLISLISYLPFALSLVFSLILLYE